MEAFTLKGKNKEQWERLVFSLEGMENSTLFVIGYDSYLLQQAVYNELKENFPQYKFQDLDLSSESIKSLNSSFNSKLPENVLNSKDCEYIVNVFGLENSLFINNNTFETSTLTDELNFERELLFREKPFITIIWTDFHTVTILKKTARDLWDWVSCYFEFKNEDGEGLLEYYPNQQTEKSEIFISYSRYDLETAQKLYNDLKKEGFSPWLDKESLLPGQNWKVEISLAMKESSFFLALLSEKSLGKRGYVQKELKTALDILNEFPLDDIYLIPVYIEACDPLDEKLRDIHGIHLYESYERGIKKLVHALKYYEKNRAGNKNNNFQISEKEQAETEDRIKKLKKNYDILSKDNTLTLRNLKEKLNIQKLLGREYMRLKEYEKADLAFKAARNLSQTIDELEYQKTQKIVPDKDRSAETKPALSKQVLDIDTLLAQAEAEKIRKEKLEQERQKAFEESKRRLEQALEKYELLLKNYGNEYKDKAWQALCSEFLMFTKDLEPGDTWTEDLTGMEFVWIPSGTFMMGQTEAEKQYLIKEVGEEEYNNEYKDELPRHEVYLDGFWMAKYEVTNKQYRQYKSDHSSGDYQEESLNGDDQPVVEVSWKDAKNFIKWLSEQKGQQFSLPTEAQWEYAARAGTETIRFWGDNPDEACKYAKVYDQTAKDKFNFDWLCHNCNGDYIVTSPVVSFLPNNFGLYDMLGNVWEWCEDVYDEKAYEKHERNNPLITTDGTNRVLRGGGWGDTPSYVRSANRHGLTAVRRHYFVGFRLCAP